MGRLIEHRGGLVRYLLGSLGCSENLGLLDRQGIGLQRLDIGRSDNLRLLERQGIGLRRLDGLVYRRGLRMLDEIRCRLVHEQQAQNARASSTWLGPTTDPDD